MSFAPIDELVAAIARGDMVIVVDDADRENEGDLIIAAEQVTPAKIGFMIRHSSGILAVPMTGERLDELQPADDGPPQHRRPSHRVHRERRCPSGHHHRNLGRRSQLGPSRF